MLFTTLARLLHRRLDETLGEGGIRLSVLRFSDALIIKVVARFNELSASRPVLVLIQ
jgi:hypothetical protein